MVSPSMLKGKLARLRTSIIGIEGSCPRPFMIRRGIFSNGIILKMPEPSLMTPASHGKLADNRSRSLVNVLMIAECEEVSVTEKQQHI